MRPYRFASEFRGRLDVSKPGCQARSSKRKKVPSFRLETPRIHMLAYTSVVWVTGECIDSPTLRSCHWPSGLHTHR